MATKNKQALADSISKEDNKKIKIFPTEKMWGIGTPEDLDTFLRNYKGS